MQEKFLRELMFARIHAGPVFASREYRKIFLRDHFPHISQVLERIHFGREYMLRLYSHLREYRKYFWGIIFRILVSCQGVFQGFDLSGEV